MLAARIARVKWHEIQPQRAKPALRSLIFDRSAKNIIMPITYEKTDENALKKKLNSFYYSADTAEALN